MSGMIDFNETNFVFDAEKNMIIRLNSPKLSEEDKINIRKQLENLPKRNYVGMGLDSFTGPSPSDLESYYSFWRIKLFSLIDVNVLCKIMQYGFDEEVIMNELGITKEELFRPNPAVIEKLENKKKSKKR